MKTVLETVDLLKEHGCVEVEEGEENDRAVSPTVLGQTATNYYLQYRTPKQMQFGVTQARKLIATAIEEDDGEKAPRNPNGKPNQLQNFSRSERVDEISLAWLLYAMSSTPEFDELPVRHNEEHLNADLAEELMWGADTTIVLNPDATPYINMDVMADPHTKCFLLIQAHLEYARLPISDYINDTKTVLDQVPRLLAAMHYIAIQDKTIAGNFDLVTQFSRARQYLATRTLVGDDPLSYFPGFSKDNLGRMRNHCRSSGKEMPSVWSLRSVSMDDATSRLKGILKSKKNNVDKMIKSIFAIPRYTIEDLKVSTELDKVTRNNVGKLIVELKIEYDTKSRGRNGRDSPITMACVLGTFQQGILLSYSSIGIAPSGSKAVTKKVEFSFDWSVANASGGADGGKIVLRFLMEDVRGMDSEILVPLR